MAVIKPTKRAAVDVTEASPGRPRDEDLSRRILDETLALLAEEGWQGLRIDDVAERCSTSKQAVYRRFASKAALAAAAVEAALAGVNPAPASDDLRTALVTALGGVAMLTTSTPFGGAIAALVGVHDEPELTACLARIEVRRRTLLQGILTQARTTGHYPADRDLEADIDSLLGAIYFRALFRRKKVDQAFVRTIVDQLLGR